MTSVMLSPLPTRLELDLLDEPLTAPTLTIRTDSCDSLSSPSIAIPDCTASYYRVLATPTAEHPLARSSVPSSSVKAAVFSTASSSFFFSFTSASRSAQCQPPALPSNNEEKEQTVTLSSSSSASTSSSAPPSPLSTTSSNASSHSSDSPPLSSSTSYSYSTAPQPPLARHRWLFYPFILPRHLLKLNLCQLAVHSLLLYMSLVCIYQVLSSAGPLQSLTPAWVMPLLLCFLVYLAIRSFVHTVFCLVRCRYSALWRLPNRHWFNKVRWVLRLLGLPLVVCSFFALSPIHPAAAHSTGLSLSYALLWSLTSILLFHLLVSWATYLFFLFIFPSSQLSPFSPFLPLDESAYPQGEQEIQRRKAGLSAARIAQLAWTVWTSSPTVSEPEMCSICMDELRTGERVRRLDCGHVYHQPCVDIWLAKRAVCPLCVRRVGKEEPNEQEEVASP